MESQALKAIIVDDEKSSRITLRNMLTDFCVNVEVLAEASSVIEAVKEINRLLPDIVFLDIEMPEQNGFKLLEYFHEINFEIIFTTAYDQYAVKAFRLSAIDYLLKPIDLEELREALQKVAEKKRFEQSQQKISALKENLNNVLKKLALPTGEGFIFVEISSILRCEASGNYSQFYFIDGSKILVSKTLKTFEEILDDFNFFRINRSNIINLSHIKKYGRQKNATITMTDGNVLTLSERRKDDFLKRFENI